MKRTISFIVFPFLGLKVYSEYSEFVVFAQAKKKKEVCE